ncbi:MAG: 2-dehydro-3-deoxy-D-gluconate 5-dehydrogenase KduD [Actinomycetota bacterium]
MGLDMFSLEGKVALVTGASRGIGESIALAFAEAGADVAVVARSADALEVLAGKIGATGRRGLAVPTDVTNEEQVAACVERVLKDLGKIDVLVNNAGGNNFLAQVADMRSSGWNKVISLNLTSAFLFSRFVGAHMRERGTGSIINMSSVAGIQGAPGLSAYSAAKFGLRGLTLTMAKELAYAGVRVNAISPGWIKTDLNTNFRADEAAEKAFVSNVPMQRWGEVHEISGAALFLASDASSYMTGQTVVVDGGLTS